MKNDEALASRFTRLLVPEPTQQEACEILGGVRESIVVRRGESGKVSLTEAVIPAVVRITSRYQPNERLPRKAIRFLKKVVQTKYWELDTADAPERPGVIDEDFVEMIARTEYGMPMDQEKEEFWQSLKRRLDEAVPGQERATSAVAAWLFRRAKNLIADRDSFRPRARFLFIGGSAETRRRLALALREAMVADANSMIIENFQQYTREESVMKLVGAPPGYVGHDDTRTVFNRVAGRPVCLVLFENAEKGHSALEPDLTSVLSGRARNSKGQETSFSQAILILSVNHELPTGATDDPELRRKLSTIGPVLTPALLEQIDAVVIFDRNDFRQTGPTLETYLAGWKEAPVELRDSKVTAALTTVMEEKQISAPVAVELWLRDYAHQLISQPATAKPASTHQTQ